MIYRDYDDQWYENAYNYYIDNVLQNLDNRQINALGYNW